MYLLCMNGSVCITKYVTELSIKMFYQSINNTAQYVYVYASFSNQILLDHPCKSHDNDHQLADLVMT